MTGGFPAHLSPLCDKKWEFVLVFLLTAIPKIVFELVLDSVENAIGSPVATALG
jgi:hypothetical protein